MPLYNLTEACKKLDITPSFVNRLQRILHYPKDISKKGIRSYFTEKEIEVIKRIYTLRLLNFSYIDIAEMLKDKTYKFSAVRKKVKTRIEYLNCLGAY